jgi:O-antigen ligase
MCVAALILVSVARLHTLVPGLHVIRPGVLLLGVASLLYLSNPHPIRSLQRLRHPLGALILFFFIWAVIGVPFGIYITNSARFASDFLIKAFAALFLVSVCIRNIYDLRRLVMTLALGGMIFALFVGLPAGYRLVSTGGYDPNDSAMFIALTMPLTVYLLVRERRLTLKILLAVALVVCTIALVRTGSRGGFLALAVVAGYLVIFFRGVRPVFRLGAVATIAIVLQMSATTEYWERMDSIGDPTDYNYTEYSGRKAIWGRARDYMVQNPVFGVGVNNFAAAEGRHPDAVKQQEAGYGVKWSAAHSMWYQVGAEMGFPGLTAFAGVFLLSLLYLRRVTRLARDSPGSPLLQEAAGLSGALSGSLLAIAVAGTFLSQAYTAMVWVPFGLILGLLKILRAEGVEVAGRSAPPPPRRRRSAVPLRPAARAMPSRSRARLGV